MIIKIVVVTDMHVGSVYGLCPTHHFNEHTNAYQLWAIDQWRNFKLNYGSPDYLILGGDIIDGPGHKNTAVLTIPDVNAQVSAAVDLLLPLVGNNTEIYGVSGSGYHYGKGTGFDGDQLVTEKLLDLTGVTGRHDRNYFGLLLKEKYGFGNIVFSHKGKNPRTQRNVLFERSYKGVYEDVLVTAHLHRKLWMQDGPLIIHTPCWEWETDFMVYTAPVDIGSTYMNLDMDKRTITGGFYPDAPIPQELFYKMNNWERLSPQRESELRGIDKKKSDEEFEKLSKLYKSIPKSTLKKVVEEVVKHTSFKGMSLPKAGIKEVKAEKKEFKLPKNLPKTSFKK
jgi:hypothetical protein